MAGGDLPTVRHHLIHRIVLPFLVVVEKAETTDAGVECETQCVRIDGMAPRPGQTVFHGTEFGVVNEEVRPLREGCIILIFRPPG